jgi:tetratricopeptide (TPR) repeat protein
MLDGLARLEEYDVFGRVVPLLDQAIGDPREASLALGDLYLQRGFYRLAGDAALEAVERGGADARALALLGKAAVAEGLFEDALPVLEEALALDPSQQSVAYLIDQVRTRAAA